MHFFKSLTYSPDKPSRQSFTQKRITLLGQAWSAICTYSLALLTLKERVYKSMDHRGAVSFNFFCCTCKCIPATITCILNILVNIKENCLLNSSWELWFVLLYPPFLYQSIHTFSLEVLWGRASCSSWLTVYDVPVFWLNIFFYSSFSHWIPDQNLWKVWRLHFPGA